MDEALLNLYTEAFLFNQEIENSRNKLKENIGRGIKEGYLAKITQDSDSALSQYKDKLKSELEKLINEKNFQEAEEVIKCINNPLTYTKIRREKDEKKHIKQKEETIERLYETPLPKNIYSESTSFSDLLEKARGYRNEQEKIKLTWNRLAKYANISVSYIVLMRKDYKIPSDAIIKRIADIMGGDPEAFMQIAKKTS